MKRRRRKITFILVLIVVAAAAVYFIAVGARSYSDYSIINYEERPDTSAATLRTVKGQILSFSNDGAMYISRSGKTIWNQSYEMTNPIEADCEEYIAFASLEGTDVCIVDTHGNASEVDVGMPIIRLDVANQGEFAVLMKSGTDSYIGVYSKDGEQIAEGKLSAGDRGTPLDIALSPSGEKLCVSVMNVASGSASSVLYVYDFSGELKQSDAAIADFTYFGCVMADIEFTGGDDLVAFCDNGVRIFNMEDTPEETAALSVDSEIKSVFCTSGYFGLVFSDEENENGRYTEIYNLKCRQISSIHTDISYGSVEFLENGEICMRESGMCSIYTLNGKEKFSYEFDEEIDSVISSYTARGYTFVTDSQIQRARLKLF